MSPFTLQIKHARSGATSSMRVLGETTVQDFKADLVRTGVAPSEALRCHVAHHGRLLGDAETLEQLRLVPLVVLAVVMPAAPPPPPPPGINFALPTREQLQAAWERAFPSGEAATAAAAPATTAAEPAAEPEPEPEERQCRVCFCGEEAGPLIQPCRCRGSMRYVHASCLNEWRAVSANARSFTRCDQCGYAYRTERHPVAEWLQSERTVLGATALALALLVLLGALLDACLLGRLHELLYSRWVLSFEPKRWLVLSALTSPTFAAVARWMPFAWGARCDALLVGLAFPGLLGFVEAARQARAAHRGLPLEEQRWAAALVLSVAADGRLILRPLLLFGAFHFGRQLTAEVRRRARRLLTRFGERVLDMAES